MPSQERFELVTMRHAVLSHILLFHRKGDAMSESISQAEVRTLRMPEAGVIMTVVASGSNLGEKAILGGFGVVKMVRGELFRASGAGIDWIETVQQSAFKIVREAVLRVDGLSREAVDGVESVSMAVMMTVRGSSEAIGDVLSRTAESLAGKSTVGPKAA
jgi:hypothetical protein